MVKTMQRTSFISTTNRKVRTPNKKGFFNTWSKEEILQNLKKIGISNEQYKYRWGDLPVLGAFINYYKMDARYFKNIKYMHASHGTVISCNDGVVNKLIDLYRIKLSQIKLSLKNFVSN